MTRIPVFPAFIVGSPRSGTSVLVEALAAAGYHGYREGNFLTLYATLAQQVERHFAGHANGNAAVLVSVVGKDRLLQQIQDVFKGMVDSYNPRTPWFDKTGNPEMLAILPALKAMWPDAAFIFAKRRALENVVSRLTKFPQHDFAYHCADWARNMSVWRATRPRLPAGCYAEVDQQDMLRQPEQVAQSLAGLLGLDAAAAAAVQVAFECNRPQQTSEDSAARTQSLEAVDWTEPQKEVFQRLCGPELDEYGYSTGPGYWR